MEQMPSQHKHSIQCILEFGALFLIKHYSVSFLLKYLKFNALSDECRGGV